MPSIRRDETIANGSESQRGDCGEDLYQDRRRRNDRDCSAAVACPRMTSASPPTARLTSSTPCLASRGLIGLDSADRADRRAAPERALPRWLCTRRSFPRGPVSQRHHRGARRASRTARSMPLEAELKPLVQFILPGGDPGRSLSPPGTHRLPPRRAPGRRAVAQAWRGRRRPACSSTSIGSVTCCSCWPASVNHRAGVADVIWKGI